MPNPKFMELASRHGNKTFPLERVVKNYPAPEDYSISEAKYRKRIEAINSGHLKEVDFTLNLIRDARINLGSEDYKYKKEAKDMKVAVVGSSLSKKNYNDIDVLVVGLLDKEFRRNLYSYVNDRLSQSGFTLSSFSYPGFSSSGTKAQGQKVITHFLVSNEDQTFKEWHEMMVDRNNKYCILNFNDRSKKW